MSLCLEPAMPFQIMEELYRTLYSWVAQALNNHNHKPLATKQMKRASQDLGCSTSQMAPRCGLAVGPLWWLWGILHRKQPSHPEVNIQLGELWRRSTFPHRSPAYPHWLHHYTWTCTDRSFAFTCLPQNNIFFFLFLNDGEGKERPSVCV